MAIIIGYEIMRTNHVLLAGIGILTYAIPAIIVNNIIGNNHIITDNTTRSISSTINNPVSVSAGTIVEYRVIGNSYSGTGMPTVNAIARYAIDNIIDIVTTLICMVDTMDIRTSRRSNTGNNITYLIVIMSTLLVCIVNTTIANRAAWICGAYVMNIVAYYTIVRSCNTNTCIGS